MVTRDSHVNARAQIVFHTAVNWEGSCDRVECSTHIAGKESALHSSDCTGFVGLRLCSGISLRNRSTPWQPGNEFSTLLSMFGALEAQTLVVTTSTPLPPTTLATSPTCRPPQTPNPLLASQCVLPARGVFSYEGYRLTPQVCPPPRNKSSS